MILTKKELFFTKDTNFFTLPNGIWLEKLSNHAEIQFFSIVLLMITVYRFFAERKTGLIYIIRTAKAGRGKLFLTRCVILSAESIRVTSLFYMESALLFLKYCGGKEGIGLPAACNESFFLTTGSMSRIEYVFVLIGVSAITSLATSLLLWYVLHFFHNVNIGVFSFLVMYAVDILAYFCISPKSIFQEFHFINLYYLLFPVKALAYHNWSCFSFVIALADSTMIFAALLGIAMILLNLRISLRRYEMDSSNIIEVTVDYIVGLFMRGLEKLPNIFMEIYKF